MTGAVSARAGGRGLGRAVVALSLAVAVSTAACTGDEGTGTATTDAASGPPAEVRSSVAPTAAPAPRPPEGACYRLTYADALSPTTDVPAVDCERRHTARTYAVGTLDAVVDGHLLAVDSERVSAQVARECPRRLGGFLGGSAADQRLSMLRSVWFTPTVAESDAGADWYRCDVVALAGRGALAPLAGRLAGVLDRPEGRRYAMCGTAAPDDPGFRRVPCPAAHSWRAVTVVDLPPGAYPGEAAVRRLGQGPCEDAGRSVAEDPLDFRWGYEWPTREQWAAGQTFGRCWAPD